MRHRVMYVVQRACRAGQRGTERTCENGADRQFRNTFRKNGSIREIRKEIATIREENLGIVGNERRKGLSMVQYHYCVVTNGEVGSVEDFSNAVFRILNSEHGWARRRDFRTFYGRQLRFQYRARPSVDLADVLVGMFGAIQLPCGQQCDYQRRSLEFRHGRVAATWRDIARW